MCRITLEEPVGMFPFNAERREEAEKKDAGTAGSSVTASKQIVQRPRLAPFVFLEGFVIQD